MRFMTGGYSWVLGVPSGALLDETLSLGLFSSTNISRANCTPRRRPHLRQSYSSLPRASNL